MLCAGAACSQIHTVLELYCTLEQYLRKKLFNYMDPSHWLLLQPHLGEDLTPLLKVRYYLWTTFSISQAQHRLRFLSYFLSQILEIIVDGIYAIFTRSEVKMLTRYIA